MGYLFADRMILSKINSWFDLNEKQEKIATKEIERFLKWHKEVELPVYASYLKDIRSGIKGGITPRKMDQYFADYQKLKFRLYDYVLPKAVDLLMEVEPKQAIHLKEALEEENKEMAEKFKMPMEKRKRIRASDHIDRFQEWIGELTAKQKRMIRNASYRLPVLSVKHMEFRSQKQKDFVRLLEQKKKNRQDIKQYLIETWYQPDEKKLSSYRILLKKSGPTWKKLLIDLYHTLSKEQKRHLLQKLEELIIDIEDIHRTAMKEKSTNKQK